MVEFLGKKSNSQSIIIISRRQVTSNDRGIKKVILMNS